MELEEKVKELINGIWILMVLIRIKLLEIFKVVYYI